MANCFIGLDFEDRDVTVGELRAFMELIKDVPHDAPLGYAFDTDGELSGIQAYL